MLTFTIHINENYHIPANSVKLALLLPLYCVSYIASCHF